MEIETVRHKALRVFLETGKAKGLMGADRIRKMIAFIAAVESVEELKIPPNYGAHELVGDRSGVWGADGDEELANDLRPGRRWTDRESGPGGLSLMAIQLHPSFAVHPGDWLRTEIVKPAGIGVTDLADHLGVTRQAMSALLNAKAGLSPEMAIRFEKAFGLKADTMLRMQLAYDLAVVRRREKGIKVERLDMAA